MQACSESETPPQPEVSSFGTPAGQVERRSKSRTKEPLHVRAWGLDVSGNPFSHDCVLDNFSETGLYLKIDRDINSGSDISLVVRLLVNSRGRATATIKGRVVRNELTDDGKHGIAVLIGDLRFI